MDRSTSLASSPIAKRQKVSPSKSPSIAETSFKCTEPLQTHEAELDRLRNENARLRVIIDDIKTLLLNSAVI